MPKRKRKRKRKNFDVRCPYCGEPAQRVKGSHVYPHRKDLDEKQFYVCDPCDARVGCHGLGRRPLGRMANAELRAAKIKAHGAFDTLWRSGEMTRSEAYHWLAEQLGITAKECHIGEFDVEDCRRVREIVALWHEGEDHPTDHRS